MVCLFTEVLEGIYNMLDMILDTEVLYGAKKIKITTFKKFIF